MHKLTKLRSKCTNLNTVISSILKYNNTNLKFNNFVM